MTGRCLRSLEISRERITSARLTVDDSLWEEV